MAATAGLSVLAMTGCSDDGPTAEQLTAQALLPIAAAADADAKTARRLIPGSTEYAAALGVVADQRAEHAQQLRAEIYRLHRATGTEFDTLTATPPSGTGVAPSNAPAPPADVGQLRTRLRESARQAHDGAITFTGYPAGLVGAVSASIVSMVEVQLS